MALLKERIIFAWCRLIRQ